MKKTLIVVAIIVTAIAVSVMLRGTLTNKLIVANWPSRIDELVDWVDSKSLSGGLKKAKNDLGSYSFVGDYDIDIDFDRSRYGLRRGAAARVVADDNHKPLSVVFIDSSHCGIAIALRVGKNSKETFGNMPSDLRLSSSRVGTFCIKRD